MFTALACAGIVWLAMHMRILGYRIRQPEIELDYIVGLMVWAVIAIGIYLLAKSDRKLLLIGWLGKLVVVLGAMLFYEQNYGLDAYWYHHVTLTGEHPHYGGVDWRTEWYLFFDEPTRHYEVSRAGELGQGTDNMIRLVMFLSYMVGPYYHALKVVLAFFGLLGVWGFYRAIVVTVGRPVPAAFYCLAFFPSILFWSSILGKDPLIFMILGLCALGTATMLVRGNPWGIPVALGALFAAFNVRPWTALMVGGTLLLTVLIRRGHLIQRATIIFLGVPLVFLAWKPIEERFHMQEKYAPEMLIISLTEGQDVRSEWTVYNAPFGGVQRAAGAVEVVESMKQGSISKGLALTIFSGLFRPLPFDVRNVFSALAAAENSLLLFLVLVAIAKFRFAYLRHPMIVWPLLYSLVWAALHGAILLANFGAGVRYKLQVLPFIVMMLFLLLHPAGRSALSLQQGVQPSGTRS